MDETIESFALLEIAALLERFGPTFLGGRPITLEIDCPADIGVMRANRLWVEQIVVNLFSNAGKFTERGVIQWRIRRTRSVSEVGDVITFAITDTGCGISTEWMDWIFKPFEIRKIYKYRNGIGLATVKSLCELMGGKINVTSQVGKGSTFTATLPAEAACQVPPSLGPL